MAPKLNMVTLKPIKYNPFGSYVCPMIQKIEDDYQPDQMKKKYTATHQDCQPQSSFLRICLTARPMTRWFPAILTSLNASVKVRLPCRSYTTRMWHRSLLNITLIASFGFATSHRDWGLWWARPRWFLSLYQDSNWYKHKDKPQWEGNRKKGTMNPRLKTLLGSIIKR